MKLNLSIIATILILFNSGCHLQPRDLNKSVGSEYFPEGSWGVYSKVLWNNEWDANLSFKDSFPLVKGAGIGRR